MPAFSSEPRQSLHGGGLSLPRQTLAPVTDTTHLPPLSGVILLTPKTVEGTNSTRSRQGENLETTTFR